MPTISEDKMLENDMYLIDAHCHLDFEVFNDDREKVLNNAAENKISDIIIPGTQKNTWKRIKKVCDDHKLHCIRLHPCYGLHPYWINNHEINDVKILEQHLDEHNAVAVGECGLDFRTLHINKKNADKKTQINFFEAQLNIAKSLQLPVVIHSVNATEAVIQSIKKVNNITGMIHSYSGSVEQAKQLIDLNFLVSIGGSATYPQAKKIKRVVSEIALTSLVVETDAPDQIDHSNIQKKRNEPAFLVNTVKEIAKLRNETIQTIAQQTTINAKQLFKI